MFPDFLEHLMGPMIVIDIAPAIEAGVEKVLQERARSALIKGVAAGEPASEIYMQFKLGR